MSGTVILARLNTLNEAHIIVGVLRQNGVPALVGEAGYASIDWLSIPALGGVSVHVPETQLGAAQTVIIETAAIGPETLTEAFGTYETPRRYGRAAVWFFWLSQFYVIQAFLIAIIIVAHQVVPADWLVQDGYSASAYYGAGGSIDWEGIADGLLLIFFILGFFALEAVSLRKPSNKDPQP